MDTVGQAVSSLSGRRASFSLAGRLALRSRYVDVRNYTYYIVGGLQQSNILCKSLEIFDFHILLVNVIFAYILAKTGADTAENEQDFAEISTKFP